MAAFNEAVSGEPFSLTAMQAALFVLTSAVMPPPQTSLGPESRCVPGYWFYDTIGNLQPFVAFTLFVFAFVTYKLKRQLATIAGDGPAPPPTRRQRAYALLALLSLAATVMGTVMAVSTSQPCWILARLDLGGKNNPTSGPIQK
ncbi:uncharacterized protein LOC125532443 [Triticum urartu]|uniref:uncharacterized protein LOC125532443 n=1 Tax=Triticum urartu TaxID=4572 RepID=UPI0020446CAF|nr:uncharacterized protein LOC125532443 [Triticum urartu]